MNKLNAKILFGVLGFIIITNQANAACTYAVSLTNISVLTQTVVTNNNATYVLNLTNTQSGSTCKGDQYTLPISNPNGASTAAINISSPYFLAKGATVIFSLNVTNTTAGTFLVNLTATSVNDSTKYAYKNTTTTVNAPDTSFTVTLPVGYSQGFFNASLKTQNNVNASGQTLSAGFLNITNTGTKTENFLMNVTSASPSGATLKAKTDNNPTGATTITTTLAQIITGLGIGASQYVWLWVDYSNAAQMNVQRTMTINSS